MSQIGADYDRLTAGAQFPALLIGFVVAFALCAALCLLVATLCHRLGALDQPGPRRIHAIPAPRLGGIAIFLSFGSVSFALFRPANANERHVYAGLLVASLLVVGVMAYDDVRGLQPIPRLCAQTVAALIVMFPAGHGALIQALHNPLTGARHGRTFLVAWVAVPFTLFWIVGMMNTINWVDGVDGLAGGVVAITALVMAAISWLLGQHTTALLCVILAGATCGFLVLNWHPARLFMGDCGAMFLGLALAVLSNTGGTKLATMALLLALPIVDAARVVARRLRQGHSPMRADRSHMHHRLLAGGLSQRQVALLFYGVTAAFGCGAIVLTAMQANGDLALLARAVHQARVGTVMISVVTVSVVALVLLVAHRLREVLVGQRRARRARRGQPVAPSPTGVPSELVLRPRENLHGGRDLDQIAGQGQVDSLRDPARLLQAVDHDVDDIARLELVD